MKKNRALIISIITLLIVMVVLVVIYIKTDLLKSNTQKFWTYIMQNSKIAEVFNSDEIKDIKSRKSNSAYTVKSNLKYDNGEVSYTVTADTDAQNSNDMITKVNFKQEENEIIKFNLVKKSNLVGIKCDELANGYITLKNNNLKELAENVGIKDTSVIPDNINYTTYVELLYLSKSDVNYLTEKYSEVISNNIDKSNYSKEESSIKIDDIIHTATGYKVTLTENDAKKILTELLKSISEDSRSLNLISSKLKLLNFPSKYTDISSLSQEFLKMAEKIDSIETTDEKLLEITAYVENKELIQTNIKIKDDRIIKIRCDKQNNKINIKQELVNKNPFSGMFIISISQYLNEIINNIQEINIINEVSNEEKSINTSFYLLFLNHSKIEYNSKTKILDSLEKNQDFDNSNKIILNELDAEKLNKLYNAIIKRVEVIYNEKKNIIVNSED